MPTEQKPIQELYEYPFIPNNNEHKTPFDKNRALQQWARPMEPGEDPMEVVQFYTYVAKSVAGTEVIRVGFFLTKDAASKSNVVPQDDPENVANNPAAYFNVPPLPIPMRELKEGESLKNTPLGLVLTVET